MDQEYQKFLSDLLQGNLDENYLPEVAAYESQDRQYESFLNDLLEGKLDEEPLFEDQKMNEESKLDYLMNIPHYISQIRQMIVDPYGNLYNISQIKNRSGKYTEFGESLRNQLFSYLSTLSKKDLEAIFIRMYFPEVKLIGRIFNIKVLIENRNEYIPLIIEFISNPSMKQNKKRKIIV
jgi:hypothetical protein